MRLRVKLFLSHFVAITVVVLAVVIAIRNIAINSVYAHMGGVTAVMGDSLQAVRQAVVQGISETILTGTIGAVVVAAVASFIVSGRLTETIGRMADAARRIAAGEYSQRVNYAVDDEIGEFASSFNEMAARLEETEQVRRELLANISHELRTPLTSIQGYMEGMIDGVVTADPETFQLVHREAARLARLVANIERLSRVEAGAERIEPRALDARRVVGDVAERLRPQLEQKQLDLALRLPDDLPLVQADEDKLVQVLTNLIGNSFQYTPTGGHIVVSAEACDGRLVFAVEDDGIGVPADDLPHIFERFYRVDKSRSAAGGGAGIGLTLTKSLVAQMGGSIRAESVLGSWTRISFSLPAASSTSSAGDATGALQAVPTQR
jgi:signal transduction histidine kinase